MQRAGDDTLGPYTEGIRVLNILRKNLQIYPPGHIQVENSLLKALGSLKALFSAGKKSVTFGVAKEAIVVGSESLNQGNPVNREFALSLKRHDIAGVIFFSDIERDELIRFFELIVKSREKIEALGGIEKAVSDSSFKQIQVKGVDFSKLHLTKERSISHWAEAGSGAESDFSWKSFIDGLLSGTLSGAKNGSPVAGDASPAPPDMARLLNENMLNKEQALKHYEELLEMQLKKGSQRSKRPADAPTADNLKLLLEGLNPELRKQFLTATLNKCSVPEAVASPEAEPLLRGLGENLVIEMLHLANEKGSQISPSLLSFIEKISLSVTSGGGSFPLTSPEGGHHPETSLESVTNLFNRETENSVAPEYKEVLDNLSSGVNPLSSEEKGDFSLDAHLKTLEESSIDFQIARVLLSFIETNVDEKIYHDYSKQLLSIIMKLDLMDRSRLSFIEEALGAFQRHVQEKPAQSIKGFAKAALDQLKDQVFTARVVQAFDKMGSGCRKETFDFLIQLGPHIVPEVLERYANRPKEDKKAHLFKLLTAYRKEALKEARRHLQDLIPSFVGNLVVFIRETGEKEDISALRPLLDHSDIEVKMEAVSALLKFHDSWGVSSLRKMVRSDRQEYQRMGVKIAGKFRVTEVVPDLIALISRLPFFESAFKKNEEVIKSLGQIGDRAAIPLFEKLLNSRFPFHAESVSHMKITIFESLSGFEYRDIEGLIEAGRRSSVYRIHKICNDLKNRNRKTPGSIP